MTKTIQPNMGFSFLPSIFFAAAIPIKIPTMERLVKTVRKVQSALTAFMELKKPSREFIDMMKSEVATALFMGNPINMTNAGTIKNPPPAPIKPVIIPTSKP